MSLKNYITLGRSGMRVSPLCLGAMTFGNEWGFGSSVEESQAVMDAYIAAGGNFIDTANMYTRGHSEKIIGDHIGRHKARRDRLVIATKFMGNLFPDDPNGGGAGRKALLGACEESLRRLQTDYIDLYWLHFHDSHTPIDETMHTLDTLVRTGKVRYIGFSDTPAWKCVQAQYEAIFRSWTPLVALQIEYSLMERTVEGDLLPMAREMGLGVTPWSPLKGGILSGKYSRSSRPDEGRGASQWVTRHLHEKTYALLDVLAGVATEVGASAAQVALTWVQGRPGVASTIIGARTLKQLDDNLGALSINLSSAQIAKLDEASKPTFNFPAEFLQGVASATHGGISINGRLPDAWPLAPKNDSERF